jgi:DNA-binding PadR family transcriptional regulator
VIYDRYSIHRITIMPRRKLDPLPQAAFHILLALADEDRHGYGIMREVAARTDNRVRLGPGTLYGSIKTMLEAKLIEELDDQPDAELGDERRRYYRLTSSGRALARDEAQQLAAVLRIARTKKILRGAHV